MNSEYGEGSSWPTQIVPAMTNPERWKPSMPQKMTKEMILSDCGQVTPEKEKWVRETATPLPDFLSQVVRQGYSLGVGEQHFMKKTEQIEGRILTLLAENPGLEKIKLVMELGTDLQEKVDAFIAGEISFRKLKAICKSKHPATGEEQPVYLRDPLLKAARKHCNKVEAICGGGLDFFTRRIVQEINALQAGEIVMSITGAYHISRNLFYSIDWSGIKNPLVSLNLIEIDNKYEQSVTENVRRAVGIQGTVVVPISGSPLERDPSIFSDRTLKHGQPLIFQGEDGNFFAANMQWDYQLVGL